MGEGAKRLRGDSDDHGLLDDDVVLRHVVVEALAARLHALDGVHDLGALHDLAEHGVAPALGGRSGVVQEAVVGHVDEELRGGRVRIAGAGHGHGVVVVLQAVLRLVLDGRIGALLVHAGLEAAALDHEAGDHAVEDRVVVVALLHVGEEVFRRLGRLLGVEFEDDHAVAGDVEFDLRVAHCVSLWGSRVGMWEMRARVAHCTTVADLITTGVEGTLWCMPRLAVSTALILSTTSLPPTTLPNTA